MRITKNYAQAIRAGIRAAKKTDFGSPNDPYYSLRSELIWGFTVPRERELALAAFRRLSGQMQIAAGETMTPEEKHAAEANFRRAHQLHIETREERQLRLLREELAITNERVQALEAKVSNPSAG